MITTECRIQMSFSDVRTWSARGTGQARRGSGSGQYAPPHAPSAPATPRAPDHRASVIKLNFTIPSTYLDCSRGIRTHDTTCCTASTGTCYVMVW